jgi:hypothetical protein
MQEEFRSFSNPQDGTGAYVVSSPLYGSCVIVMPIEDHVHPGLLVCASIALKDQSNPPPKGMMVSAYVDEERRTLVATFTWHADDYRPREAITRAGNHVATVFNTVKALQFALAVDDAW